jgi:hypothetical protein
MWWPWTPAARRRKNCWHHDRPHWTQGVAESRSYIREELIEMGSRKRFWCSRAAGGCGQMWFTP